VANEKIANAEKTSNDEKMANAEKMANDEYARLMESSAQLMESLQLSIGQVAQVLHQMAKLFRSMPSGQAYREFRAMVEQMQGSKEVGDGDG
jgi:hypothetical protein